MSPNVHRRLLVLFVLAALSALGVAPLSGVAQTPATSAASTDTWPAQREVEALRKRIEARLAGGRFSKADFDRAVEPLERILKGEAKENPLAWAFHGFLWMRVLRNPTVAASDFDKALAIDPTHPEACAWSAQLLMATRKPAEAKKRLEGAVRAHPGAIVVQAAWIDVLAAERKWPDVESHAEALLVTARALPAGKKRTDAIVHGATRAGQAEAQQGKFRDAVKHYAIAVAEQPKNADLLFAYAEVLEKNGDALGATRELNKIPALIPKGARYDAARQRVLGKVAMLEKAAAKQRLAQQSRVKKQAESRVAKAIVEHVERTGADIGAFDGGNGNVMTEFVLNSKRSKGAPRLPTLQKMTAAQKKALYAALDQRAAAEAVRPSMALMRRLATNPKDADAREALLALVKNADGEDWNAKVVAVAPARYWARIPVPASKEHLSPELIERRDRALERYDATRTRLARDVPLVGKSTSIRSYPGRWRWMRDAEAVVRETDAILAIYPLPAAWEARAFALWRLGRMADALDAAILGRLSYRFSVAHQYRGGGVRVGFRPWLENTWLATGFGPRTGRGWKAPPAEQDALARKILAAVEGGQWKTAAALILPRAKNPRGFGTVAVTLQAAMNIAIDLDTDRAMVETVLAPTRERAVAGADAKTIEAAIRVASEYGGGDCAPVALLRATVAEREKDAAEAVKQLKLALQYEPENPSALHRRGQQLERTGDRRGAMLHYNAAIGARPAAKVEAAWKPVAAARSRLEKPFGKALAKQYVEGYNALSRSAERETYGVQLAAIERLQQLGLSTLECRRLRVIVLRHLERSRDALAEAKRYLATKNADRALGNEQLGAILRDLGEHAGSEAAYGKAIAAGSQNPNAWHWRGSARVKLERFDDAMADFDETLKRGGTRPWTQLHRARILLKRDDWPGADAAYAEAIKLAAAQKKTRLSSQISAERSRERKAHGPKKAKK